MQVPVDAITLLASDAPRTFSQQIDPVTQIEWEGWATLRGRGRIFQDILEEKIRPVAQIEWGGGLDFIEKVGKEGFIS